MFGDMQSDVCGKAAAGSPRSEAEGRSIPEEDDRTPPTKRTKKPAEAILGRNLGGPVCLVRGEI